MGELLNGRFLKRSIAAVLVATPGIGINSHEVHAAPAINKPAILSSEPAAIGQSLDAIGPNGDQLIVTASGVYELIADKLTRQGDAPKVRSLAAAAMSSDNAQLIAGSNPDGTSSLYSSTPEDPSLTQIQLPKGIGSIASIAFFSDKSNKAVVVSRMGNKSIISIADSHTKRDTEVAAESNNIGVFQILPDPKQKGIMRVYGQQYNPATRQSEITVTKVLETANPNVIGTSEPIFSVGSDPAVAGFVTDQGQIGLVTPDLSNKPQEVKLYNPNGKLVSDIPTTKLDPEQDQHTAIISIGYNNENEKAAFTGAIVPDGEVAKTMIGEVSIINNKIDPATAKITKLPDLPDMYSPPTDPHIITLGGKPILEANTNAYGPIIVYNGQACFVKGLDQR